MVGVMELVGGEGVGDWRGGEEESRGIGRKGVE